MNKMYTLLLDDFFLFSTGLKCTPGIGHTNSIGAASIKQ